MNRRPTTRPSEHVFVMDTGAGAEPLQAGAATGARCSAPRKGEALSQAQRNRLRARKRSFRHGVQSVLRPPPGLVPCWQENMEDYGEFKSIDETGPKYYIGGR